jgi:hypothetical protein
MTEQPPLAEPIEHSPRNCWRDVLSCLRAGIELSELERVTSGLQLPNKFATAARLFEMIRSYRVSRLTDAEYAGLHILVHVPRSAAAHGHCEDWPVIPTPACHLLISIAVVSESVIRNDSHQSPALLMLARMADNCFTEQGLLATAAAMNMFEQGSSWTARQVELLRMAQLACCESASLKYANRLMQSARDVLSARTAMQAKGSGAAWGNWFAVLAMARAEVWPTLNASLDRT